MFGREKLKTKLSTATEELERIKSSPYYKIAQEIEEEVDDSLEGVVIDPGSIKPLIDKAVAERRTRRLEERTSALTAQKANELIGAEKEKIERRARRAAERAAQLALQKFMKEDATAYREKRQKHLTEKCGAQILKEAQKQIDQEERQKLVDAAKEKLSQEAQAHDKYKSKAQELRKATKNTEILPFNLLEVDDPLTICFVERGSGHEPLTDGGYYGSTYRTELEKRKLTCRLVDSDKGLFEVVKDSWLEDGNHHDEVLRGGKQVRLLSRDPEGTDYKPMAVKGEELLMLNAQNKSVAPDEALEVWWVELGEFKALS